MIQIDFTIDHTEYPDDEKFRELVLYVAEKSEGDTNFGATKLNKLLFYADFVFYQRFGTSITRHQYQKLEHGPAPKALKPILATMQAEGVIKEVERTHYGRSQRRVLALRNANLSVFTPEEVAFVDGILRDFASKSAKEVSDLSHRFIGWKYAEIGETIPYQVTLVARRPPTREESAFGEQLEVRANGILSRAG